MSIELTPEELESIRAPIERASTLPARAFTSTGFFEIEMARIFCRRWMAVGFEVTLSEPGDMRPIEILGQPRYGPEAPRASVAPYSVPCPVRRS